MAQKTVLDYPEVVDSSRDDVLYTIRGVGADRDKQSRVVPVLNNLIYSVSTQDEFNALIEQTSTNNYKFKDEVRAVFFKYLAGGYNVYKDTTDDGPLIVPDYYAILDTNNVTWMQMEGGTFLDFGRTTGYLKVTAPDCYLNGIHVKGSDNDNGDPTPTAYLSSTYGIKIESTATNTRLYNCTVSGFLPPPSTTGVTFAGIAGSNTATDDTLYASNCRVRDIAIDSSRATADIYGFQYIHNLHNCRTENIDVYIQPSPTRYIRGFYECDNIDTCKVSTVENTSGTGQVMGFESCNILQNSIVDTLGGSTTLTRAFYLCNKLSNCDAVNIGHITNVQQAYGFRDCNRLTGCFIDNLQASSTTRRGFYNCDYCVNCTIENSTVDEAFYQCDYLTNCRANNISLVNYAYYECKYLTNCSVNSASHTSTAIIAFQTCLYLSCCDANSITTSAGDAYGFNDCDILSSCRVNGLSYTGAGANNAIAYNICNVLSSCAGTNVTVGGTGTAQGFNTCQYGSSLFSNVAVNPNNDWMDTNDPQISNKYSTPAIWT